MTLSRRSFVHAGAALLAGVGFYRLYRHYRPYRPAHLILLYQEGGADALSMVVPHAEAAYYSARPRLAVPRKSVIDLDGHFGLNAALSPLLPFWREGSLAVIPAVGLPHSTRSHFAARAALAKALRPRDDRGFLSASTKSSETNIGLCERTERLATEIVKREAPEVAVIRSGGWDTHWDQGGAEGNLAARFHELGSALAVFAARLGSRLDDVVLITVSEFGRTIAENRNGGTDHGAATAMLILGGRVNGGRVLGSWSPLEAVPADGVPIATDMRQVIEELLGGPDASMPAALTHTPNPLGIVRA